MSISLIQKYNVPGPRYTSYPTVPYWEENLFSLEQWKNTFSRTLLLFIALFMKKEHYVKCEIIINVSKQKVYDFLKFLKNQDKFNKWAKAYPDRNWEYKGEDGTVGFIIS